MTTFPASPKIQKGAIIGIDIFNPLASVIIFQYNPDTMSRSLKAQTSGTDSGSRAESMRLKGAPVETISLSVEVDATDQLEGGSGIASSMGIYPQLSALEMLIYPKSAVVIANTVLAALGTTELIAPEAPLTLFIWGVKRVLPVRITGFTITEEAYDTNLNPIRAKAALSMRVLSYNDLSITDPAYYLFLAHQVIKETMAVIGSMGNIAGVGAPAVSGSASVSVSGSFNLG
jgi:hypothetical protein